MMQFNIHPSDTLLHLFREKPYQGQSPQKANIIFLSSDANYSDEISNHSFFQYITEYQQDGVKFWEKHSRHHPFLLDSFPFKKNSGGRPFHKTFSRLGLTKEYASNISFIELLDIPTIGNKSNNKELFYSFINIKHLKFIDNLICSDTNKLIFISNGVLKDMNVIKGKFDVFRWLNDDRSRKPIFSKKINSNHIQEIYHFSSPHVNRQLDEIKSTIDQWLNINGNKKNTLIVDQEVSGNNHLAVNGKTCSICNCWFQSAEFAYGNRENMSYCKSCNKENQAAYALGGTKAARNYREEKRASWAKPK
jgi:hypothetical protein